jgi:hypothetical protein
MNDKNDIAMQWDSTSRLDPMKIGVFNRKNAKKTGEN